MPITKHFLTIAPCTTIRHGFTALAARATGYNPRLQKTPNHRVSSLISALLACVAALAPLGCNTPPDRAAESAQPQARPAAPPDAGHVATRSIDLFDPLLLGVAQDPDKDAKTKRALRLRYYNERWPAVKRAVAHHGTTHREAFYGSRAFWHTGSTRGLGWALDQRADLDEPVYVDSKGNVRVAGDANADIEVRGDAIVHVLGDLNATLELKGVCEVVVAGRLTENATIVCDGQLDLFVGGDSLGVFGATNSATIVIDGDASGVIQCGAPATTVTVTGDLAAELPAPKDEDAVLTLRVDGFVPTAAMLNLATAGFTRVNATLGKSNVPPGLYPENAVAGARPTARWVVLQQGQAD